MSNATTMLGMQRPQSRTFRSRLNKVIQRRPFLPRHIWHGNRLQAMSRTCKSRDTQDLTCKPPLQPGAVLRAPCRRANIAAGLSSLVRAVQVCAQMLHRLSSVWAVAEMFHTHRRNAGQPLRASRRYECREQRERLRTGTACACLRRRCADAYVALTSEIRGEVLDLGSWCAAFNYG